ncbi:HeH/LEM domain-containing protein, partial [Enterococcus faecium]
MKVSELKHLLDEKNISYKSSDKREDLIALLEDKVHI